MPFDYITDEEHREYLEMASGAASETYRKEIARLTEANKTLTAENAELRAKEETWHKLYQQAVVRENEVTSERDRLAARMREALEFYADISKYPAPFTGGMGALWSDCGQIARAALANRADAAPVTP